MFLHIRTYIIEFKKSYLHSIIEISVVVMIVKDDIILRPVVTWGRGVTDPQSRVK